MTDDQGRRALIIEPDPRVRHELEEALARRGWSTVGAASSEEAFEQLDAHEPPGLVFIGLLASPREEWLFGRWMERDPRLRDAVLMVASEDRPGEFEVHVDGQLERPPGNGFSLEAAIQFGETHLARGSAAEAAPA